MDREADAILVAIADALDAASHVLRQRAAVLSVGVQEPEDAGPTDIVSLARAIHPQLGPRQAQLLDLLAQAGPDGTDTGSLSREMGYDQPNVYLTLQQMMPLGFVEKDETTRPHTYRLGEIPSSSAAYRMGQAIKKYEASGAAALGVPQPQSYSNVDGIVAKGIFVGPDADGNTVVVRRGELLGTYSTRSEAMEFFSTIKYES